MKVSLSTLRVAVAAGILAGFASFPTGDVRAQDGVISGRVFIAGGALCTNVAVYDVWKPLPWSSSRRSTRTDDQGRFIFSGLTSHVHYVYTDAWNTSTNNVADLWYSSTKQVFVKRQSSGQPNFNDIPEDVTGFDFTGPLHTNYANFALPHGGRVSVEVGNRRGEPIAGGDVGAYYRTGRDSYGLVPRVQTDGSGRADFDKLWPDSFYFYTRATHTNVYDQYHPGVEYYGPPSSYDMPEGTEAVDIHPGETTNSAFSLRDAAALPVRMLDTNSMPVRLVSVSVRDAQGRTVSTIKTTDSDGRATVTKVKPGRHYLFAQPNALTGQMNEYGGDDSASEQAWVHDRFAIPPFGAQSIVSDPGTPLGTNVYEMTLDDPPDLTVNVRHGESGDPLAGIVVTGHGPEGQTYGSDHTDAGGQSTPSVLPGYVFLSGWPQRFDSTNVMPTYHSGALPSADDTRLPTDATPVLLTPGMQTTVDVDMLSGIPLTITVNDGPSNSAARMYADGAFLGEFDISGPPGAATGYVPPNSTVTVTVKPPSGSGWLSRSAELAMGSSSHTGGVSLGGPVSIEGGVVLDDGGSLTPSPGGYLNVRRPNSLGGYDSGYVDVQPDGSFSLHGLHTGDVCTITAHPPAGVGGGQIPFQAMTTNETIGSGPNPLPVTITLERGSQVSGNVGASVPVLGVDDDGNIIASTEADANGNYTLTLPGNQEVFLRTEHRGSYPGSWIDITTNTYIATTPRPPIGLSPILSPGAGLVTNMSPVTLNDSPGTFEFNITTRRHGHAVSGSAFIVSTPDGFTVAEGDLDPGGSALVTGLPQDTPLAAGANRDGYRTVWYPGVFGDDDITVVPTGAWTITIDSGGPVSTNEISLSLGEPGPSPLISDVSPEITVTPTTALVGRDNLWTEIVVNNAGPHLSTAATVRVHHGATGGYWFAASEHGGYNSANGETTWTVSDLPPGCSHTGRVVIVPAATGRYESVVAALHAGFDPDGMNNTNRVPLDYVGGADDDGDDIPNWFELEMTGATTGLVAGADGDRDGITNGDEWILRWDPTVSNTPFSLLPVEPDPQGGASVAVPTETGRVYTLYRSLDILGNPVWTPLVTYGGTGDPLLIRDPYAATQAWYRAGVRAP